jgi:hypothetical protein
MVGYIQVQLPDLSWTPSGRCRTYKLLNDYCDKRKMYADQYELRSILFAKVWGQLRSPSPAEVEAVNALTAEGQALLLAHEDLNAHIVEVSIPWYKRALEIITYPLGPFKWRSGLRSLGLPRD